MSKELSESLDHLLESAKEVGAMRAEADLADVTVVAHILLCDYGRNLDRYDHNRFMLAERLWNSIRKISPDLKIPPFLWTYQERCDEARLEAQHIAEDHGVPGGDK